MWGALKNLSWVGGLTTLFSTFALVVVVLVWRYRATKKAYRNLLVAVLLVLLVCIVYLWIALGEVANDLNSARAGAVAANTAGCVTDAGWAKVLSSWVENTNLDSLHSWMGWLVGLTSLTWVVSVLVLFGAW